jgi:hypothetical protein
MLGLLVLNWTPAHSEDGHAERSTVRSPPTMTKVSLPSSVALTATCAYCEAF